jgi:hypothetical protein
MTDSRIRQKFVFGCVSGKIGQAKAAIRDTVSRFPPTTDTASCIARRFPLSQDLRSTTHAEQQIKEDKFLSWSPNLRPEYSS